MIKDLVTLVVFVILGVNAEITNYDDVDIDSVFDDLFNDFYDNLMSDKKESKISVTKDEQPIFSNGTWMCGDCSNVDESKLLYGESFELDTNDDLNGYIETQIGFALNDMKCIVLQTDERNTIRRVTGSCIGDEVILSVLAAFNTDIKIYG